MTRQGTLEQRPAAGKRGRLYFATTRSSPYNGNAVPWNLLYRDNGTSWDQLNASALQAFLPTFGAVNGETPPYTISVNNGLGVASYQVRPNGMCWIDVHLLVTLQGSGQSSSGIAMALPIAPKEGYPSVVSSTYQNALTRGVIDPNQGTVNLYPEGWNNQAQWVVNNFNYWLRVTGEYAIN